MVYDMALGGGGGGCLQEDYQSLAGQSLPTSAWITFQDLNFQCEVWWVGLHTDN